MVVIGVTEGRIIEEEIEEGRETIENMDMEERNTKKKKENMKRKINQMIKDNIVDKYIKIYEIIIHKKYDELNIKNRILFDQFEGKFCIKFEKPGT